MVRLDAAVEDADADACAGRPSPRPLAGDLAGPGLGQLDTLDRVGREAPGGKWFLGHQGRSVSRSPSGGRSVSSIPPGARPAASRGSDPRGDAGAARRLRARGDTGAAWGSGTQGASLG